MDTKQNYVQTEGFFFATLRPTPYVASALAHRKVNLAVSPVGRTNRIGSAIPTCARGTRRQAPAHRPWCLPCGQAVHPGACWIFFQFFISIKYYIYQSSSPFLLHFSIYQTVMRTNCFLEKSYLYDCR
jgi:hypothetical protein